MLGVQPADFQLDALVIWCAKVEQGAKMLVICRGGYCTCMPMRLGVEVEALVPMCLAPVQLAPHPIASSVS